MEAHEQLVLRLALHVHRAVERGVLHAADALHGIPELRHAPRLVRGDPGVVGLVVAPAADHQLEVRAVVVGEHGVPHVRLGEVAPEEELLAHGDVAVRDVRRAALLLVVVAGEPGVVGVHREDGARLDREVAPPGEVHHAGDVVGVLRALRGQQLHLLLARADREARPVVLVVVEPEVAARREEDLVVVAAVHRDVRPVDHRLDPRLAVHEDVLRLQNGAVGEKREADRPFKAAPELRLANPDRLRAVRVVDRAPVDGHCRRRAVMVREVPFDAAGYPRAEHSDERGLYDMLAVERFVARRLVGEIEEMPAVLGEKPHLEPVVLERQVLVRLVELLVVQHVLHRIRVDAPLRALVDAPGVEERRLVVASRRVRRKDNRILLE